MKHTRARAEAKQLVQTLRRSNQKAERSGAAKLPDEEYDVLEEELTRKLLLRAA
jgi:hypothetical protein